MLTQIHTYTITQTYSVEPKKLALFFCTP